MTMRRTLTTLAVAALALAACSREVGNNAQSKPGVGAKIDSAIDSTQRKLERAGEKAKQEITEASEKTQETLTKAGQKTQETLSKAGDKISAATSKGGTATPSSAGSTPPYAPRQGVQSTPSDDTAPATTTTAMSTGPATAVKSANVPSEKSTALSDAAITASVKADFLKDPDLSVLKIEVDTRDGVVTLNGLAENEPAKQRAERMAEAVKGVRQVRNYLTIKRG